MYFSSKLCELYQRRYPISQRQTHKLSKRKFEGQNNVPASTPERCCEAETGNWKGNESRVRIQTGSFVMSFVTQSVGIHGYCVSVRGCYPRRLWPDHTLRTARGKLVRVTRSRCRQDMPCFTCHKRTGRSLVGTFNEFAMLRNSDREEMFLVNVRETFTRNKCVHF